MNKPNYAYNIISKLVLSFILIFWYFFAAHFFVNVPPGHQGVAISKLFGEEQILKEGMNFPVSNIFNEIIVQKKFVEKENTYKEVYVFSDGNERIDKPKYPTAVAAVKRLTKEGVIEKNEVTPTMKASISDSDGFFKHFEKSIPPAEPIATEPVKDNKRKRIKLI